MLVLQISVDEQRDQPESTVAVIDIAVGNVFQTLVRQKRRRNGRRNTH